MIACDCNSNPASPAARSALPIGSGAAYRLITKDHGFTDLWLQQPGRADPGNTAWLSELVNDETAGLQRRIDLVLARSAPPVADRGQPSGSHRGRAERSRPGQQALAVRPRGRRRAAADRLSVMFDALSPQRRRLVLGAGSRGVAADHDGCCDCRRPR